MLDETMQKQARERLIEELHQEADEARAEIIAGKQAVFDTADELFEAIEKK